MSYRWCAISALADGGNAWKNAFLKAKAVVSQMTLEEKGMLYHPIVE
jgi:hypothetical protein